MAADPPRILTPLAFDAGAASWRPVEEERARPQPKRELTLVTWNVWFAEHHLEARADRLLELVRGCDADVICLQEVTRPFLERLLETGWIREGYWVSDATGDTLDGYGVVIVSRLPCATLRLFGLPSNMGRRLLVAELLTPAGRLAVGTVHLESMRGREEARAAQLELAFPVLKAIAPSAVLCGDFNFGAGWRESEALDRGFVDVWPALRGASDDGFTIDAGVNRMLHTFSGTDDPVRFDRVMLRSKMVKARSIALLGTEAIAESEPDVFPSDHFGLVVRFR